MYRRGAVTGHRRGGPRRALRRLVGGNEFQRDAVHAVAQASGRRAVVEHVAEVTTAAAAVHFRARDQQRAVDRCADGTLERRVEARPAGAAFELGIGAEQRQVATRAGERSLALLAIERTGIRVLGAVLAQHAVLGGLEDAAPLVVALDRLERTRRLDVATAQPRHAGDHGGAAATEKQQPAIDHGCLRASSTDYELLLLLPHNSSRR